MAQEGEQEALVLLLEYCADAALLDRQCQTPLHLAAGAGHARVVAALLKSKQVDDEDEVSA
jgi:ankyrin repeat protein